MKKTNHYLAQMVFLAFAGFSPSVFALQPLITDDTGTQGTGGNQLEASYNADRARSAGQDSWVRTVPLVYTRGVLENLDLFIDTRYVRVNPVDAKKQSGIGNSVIGAKWRFYEDEERGFSLGVKPEIALPVSSGREDDGLGLGQTSGALTFLFNQEVPFGTILANVGIARERYRNSDNGPNATTTYFSLAPVWNVSEQWRLALDVGVRYERAGSNSTQRRFAEVGTIYQPSEDLEFALGVIRLVDNDNPQTKSWIATTGITWRFK